MLVLLAILDEVKSTPVPTEEHCFLYFRSISVIIICMMHMPHTSP